MPGLPAQLLQWWAPAGPGTWRVLGRPLALGSAPGLGLSWLKWLLCTQTLWQENEIDECTAGWAENLVAPPGDAEPWGPPLLLSRNPAAARGRE